MIVLLLQWALCDAIIGGDVLTIADTGDQRSKVVTFFISHSMIVYVGIKRIDTCVICLYEWIRENKSTFGYLERFAQTPE